MINSPLVLWSTAILVIISTALSIVKLVIEISQAGHPRNITKKFMIAGVFPAGICLGGLFFYWISLIKTSHTFQCIFNTINCTYMNPFLIFLAGIFLLAFTLTCGAFSSWGMWVFVKKYIP